MEICIYAGEETGKERVLVDSCLGPGPSSPGSHDNDLITGIMGFRGIGIIQLENALGGPRRSVLLSPWGSHSSWPVPVSTFASGTFFRPRLFPSRRHDCFQIFQASDESENAESCWE